MLASPFLVYFTYYRVLVHIHTADEDRIPLCVAEQYQTVCNATLPLWSHASVSPGLAHTVAALEADQKRVTVGK